MVSIHEVVFSKRDMFINHLVGQLPVGSHDAPPRGFVFDITEASRVSGLRGSRMYQLISELGCVMERDPVFKGRAIRSVRIVVGYETVGEVKRILELSRREAPAVRHAADWADRHREAVVRIVGTYAPRLGDGDVVNVTDLLTDVDASGFTYVHRKIITKGVFTELAASGIQLRSVRVVGGETLLYDKNVPAKRTSILRQLDRMEEKHHDFPLYLLRIRDFRRRLKLGLIGPFQSR